MYLQRIGDLRTDKDLRQKDVANMLGLNVEVYRHYEKGERDIPIWALVKLAEYYHTSTDYILGRTNDPRPPRAGGKDKNAPLVKGERFCYIIFSCGSEWEQYLIRNDSVW